jgi:hypothetical protein
MELSQRPKRSPVLDKTIDYRPHIQRHISPVWVNSIQALWLKAIVGQHLHKPTFFQFARDILFKAVWPGF